MVEFAGYDMPLQYADGILKEHLHVREKCGLFDVSHMGQAFLLPAGARIGTDAAHDAAADAIETLVPGDILKLKKGAQRYSVLLNDNGGILDDLMIARPFRDSGQGMLYLVVNAGRKTEDFALLRVRLRGKVDLQVLDDRSLVALQGPRAAFVLEAQIPGVAAQQFMSLRPYEWRGALLTISRSGYTGEDGFEISVPNANAEEFARALLANSDVKPIGLGARDSLRLEAGLCLYGHDIDTTTSPVEANLSFVLGKRRREARDFPGAERILRELVQGPKRLRVGLKPEGRAPAREGAEIRKDGAVVGKVTSGGFGPPAGGPIAMGYVEAAFAEPGAKLDLIVRDKPLPASVVALPFVPHRYWRG
jgi:aminomethyltransferase